VIYESFKNQKKQKPPGWLVENIAEASKNARKIYLLYITFLAYCALSVAGTSDRQIILNESIRLPLMNADVSAIGFFLVAPLMAILLFVYLQLYLSRIHGLITDLRTSYAPIEKRRLYPWLLNIAEDPEPGFIGKLQRGIAQCSLWWLLPAVLMLFAFWFVKTHWPVLSRVVGVLPILGTLVVLYFWSHYEASQYKSRSRIIQVLGFLFKGKAKVALASIVLAFEIVLLCCLIPWAARGGKYPSLKPWICVDLSYQVFTTKPEEGHPNIYWAKLREAHLEGADFTSTVLTGAELRGANLQGANLSGAKLQGAYLAFANLQGANLMFAKFQGANLWSANLQGAYLKGANLQEAFLMDADLRGIHLEKAPSEDELRDLTRLLSKAETLYEAKIDSELQERLHENHPHLFWPPKD